MAAKDEVRRLNEPSGRRQKAARLPIFLICIISLFSLIFLSAGPVLAEELLAPNFSATSWDNDSFNLSDLEGSPVVLHITNIENPLCIECEESLQGQVKELATLKAIHPDVQIVTLNLRKNPTLWTGGEAGRKLGSQCTWPGSRIWTHIP